jgi:hypothetical protein
MEMLQMIHSTSSGECTWYKRSRHSFVIVFCGDPRRNAASTAHACFSVNVLFLIKLAFFGKHSPNSTEFPDESKRD